MQLDPATLDEYVGVYRFDETTTRTIFREGDKLIAQRSGGEKQEILAASRDDFFYADSDSRIHFRRDAQGKITGMDFLRRFGPDEIGAKTGRAAPRPSARRSRWTPASMMPMWASTSWRPAFQLTLTREGDQLMGQADRPAEGSSSSPSRRPSSS